MWSKDSDSSPVSEISEIGDHHNHHHEARTVTSTTTLQVLEDMDQAITQWSPKCSEGAGGRCHREDGSSICFSPALPAGRQRAPT